MPFDLEERPNLKTSPVPIRPGLSLYRQPKGPSIGSPNWYARARVKLGNRKVHVKSMGTTDERLARERAEEFYTDLCILKRGGQTETVICRGPMADRAYRFEILADAFLDGLQLAVGDDARRLQRYRDHKAILLAPNGLCAFFKTTDIRTITPNKIREFLVFAEKRSRRGKLKPTTQRNMLATLRPVLAFAVDEGLLDRIPKMPTVRMKDNPRSSFNRAELDHLLATCRKLVGQTPTDAERDRWLEMQDFIEIMVATFLRPSEWVDLKHGDIRVVEDGRTPHLEIALSRGKTGKRRVWSMPEAVGAYDRLVARHGGNPLDFVFVSGRNSRDGAIARMRKAFAVLLKAADLECDEFGSKRVIYSLRHTGLSLRIIEGDHVDPILLARNAGTSVEMLERFYSSRVSPLDNLENLQSRRRKVRPANDMVEAFARLALSPVPKMKVISCWHSTGRAKPLNMPPA